MQTGEDEQTGGNPAPVTLLGPTLQLHVWCRSANEGRAQDREGLMEDSKFDDPSLLL